MNSIPHGSGTKWNARQIFGNSDRLRELQILRKYYYLFVRISHSSRRIMICLTLSKLPLYPIPLHIAIYPPFTLYYTLPPIGTIAIRRIGSACKGEANLGYEQSIHGLQLNISLYTDRLYTRMRITPYARDSKCKYRG